MLFRRTSLISFLLLSGFLLVMVTPSSAIPVFARKYGYNCTMCHSSFPRLNDYGQRYRGNGYALPGRENEERNIRQTQTPIAIRTSAGYNIDRFKNVDGSTDTRKFQINGLDILSAGLFNQNIGYMFVYLPQITQSEGVVAQDGDLEAASLVFHLSRDRFDRRWASLRVGRFEPASTVFSVKRQLSVSPYEIYDFTFPGGYSLAQTQEGIEAVGDVPLNIHYAAGWTNGSQTNRSNEHASDYYGRIYKVFGQGEGQTAGQRLGIVGHYGKARADTTLAALPLEDRHYFRRVGVDVSMNLPCWNLGLQYLAAADSRSLWDDGSPLWVGANPQVRYHGGFAEITYMPITAVAAFARYDSVTTPDRVNADIDRWTAGGRYYPEENLALHLEYSRREQELPAPAPFARENFYTGRLDFAF